jgi:hypothetical protein
MGSPQFTKRTSRPMDRGSYEHIVKKLRRFADEIERNKKGETEEQRKALKRAVRDIAGFGKHLLAWSRIPQEAHEHETSIETDQ